MKFERIVAENLPLDLKVFNAEIEAFNKDIPSIVAVLNPEAVSAKEQKTAFLEGSIDNPAFVYPKIAAITEDDIESYHVTADHLLACAENLDEPNKSVYREFINENLKKASLVMAMKTYNEAEAPEEKDAARHDFMRQNIELFGEPDETTYYSLL